MSVGRKDSVDRLKDVKHLALDLDGTLYLGGRLFEWTAPFLATAKKLGLTRTFFTNNSSRSTKDYVKKLNGLGIDATEGDVYSSTTSTIEYLKEERPGAKRLWILGTPALRGEFAEAGFTVCEDSPADEPDAVVVGFDTTLAYDRLCRTAWWIGKGKPFVATHPDRTCPTDEPSVWVDCGAVCAMLTSATGRKPDAVMGKPNPRMLGGMSKRHGLKSEQVAVVGDRLYTDMAMARQAGAMGILVLSGETTREQLAAAAVEQPDLVVENVGELSELLVAAKR